MQNAEKRLESKPETDLLSPHPLWRWVSERGLLVATGEATLARYKFLFSQNLPEVEDMIPADGCLLLVLHRGASVSRALREALVSPLAGSQETVSKLHEIVVEYGGVVGPDLPELAERAGLDVADYIDCHATAQYTVAFLGFQPGFPYLRGLPSALRAPRRASPRVRVVAGSVAIGGAYAGIYPADSPGGWQIIGRTTANLFDSRRHAPALLMSGDRLRFVPT